MEFGVKYFIDIHYRENKLEHRPLQKSILFTSQRILNGNPSIKKATKREVFSTLIRDAVVGIGLYQGVEFLFSHSSWEVLSKFQIAIKRFRLALRLTLNSKTYHMSLSRDISKNTYLLKEFIQNLIL